MTGAASLALATMSASSVRAEIVTVQGANGAAGSDASNSGNDAQSGGDGKSVSANAGSTQPITAPRIKPSQEAAAVARAATVFMAIPLLKAVVLAEMGALRTQQHSRPSSLARGERKPVPTVGTGAGPELHHRVSGTAGRQWRQRRIGNRDCGDDDHLGGRGSERQC